MIIITVYLKKINFGVNISGLAKNFLDVGGNMVIGANIAGEILASPNSVMVQSKMGIGTPHPKATLDVRGSMVVGHSQLIWVVFLV